MANITTVLKFSLKTNIVKSILNEIISNTSRYYYTFGRARPWDTVTTTEDGQTVVISSEDSPPSALDTRSYELEVRKNMLLTKYIDPNDASIVVQRKNWIPGIIYDMYDEYDDTYRTVSGGNSLDQANFYVMTSDFNVYKCLFNNNRGISVVQPFGTSTLSIELSDGYIWKFMYTIPLSFRNKFLSTDYMPVLTALNNQFYSKGTITNYTIVDPGFAYVPNFYKVKYINVINAGVNYTDCIITFPTPSGVGGVTATAVATITNGQITLITVTNPGSGYTSPPEPIITATDGSGFVYTIEYDKDTTSAYTEVKVIGDGRNSSNPYTLKTITVENGGEFDSPPAGSLFSFPNPDLAGGKKPEVNITTALKTMPVINGTWTVSGSSIIQITTDTNHEYSNGNSVNITFVSTSGTNATSGTYSIANVTANTFTIINSAGSITGAGTLTATLVKYEVTDVEVTYGGYGYSFPLIFGSNVYAATLSSGGFICDLNVNTQKNEAELIPLITPTGEIASLIVLDAGIGYSYASVQITSYIKIGLVYHPITNIIGDPGYDSTFKKASVVLNFGIGDVDTKQSNVELFAVDGAIDVIRVASPGEGYPTTTTLQVIGDGTGCTAVPVLENGKFVKVNITNRGFGYSNASVIIDGGGSGAVLKPVLSPKGGHGKDAVSELFAKTISLVTKLSNEKNQGVITSNDYRQISIIKNPRVYLNDQSFKNSLGSGCAAFVCEINASNTATYTLLEQDDILYFSPAQRFVLVEKAIVSNKYYLIVNLLDNYVPSTGSNIYVIKEETSPVINISSIFLPDFNKYSGEMLYIDNRTAFSPSENQAISLSTLISF